MKENKMNITFNTVNEINGNEGYSTKHFSSGTELLGWVKESHRDNQNNLTNEYWVEDITLDFSGSSADKDFKGLNGLTTGSNFETPTSLLKYMITEGE